MKNLDLYIDASKKERIGRCAGILIDDKENETKFSYFVDDDLIKKALKINTDIITVTCYEMFSFFIFLNRIKSYKEKANIIVYTDHQMFFNAFNNVGKISKQDIVAKKLLYNIKNAVGKLKINDIYIELRWLPRNVAYYSRKADNLSKINNNIKLRFIQDPT